MANRKQPASDFNTDIAAAVRKATGTKPGKGGDLISDPKLRKAYLDAKKRFANKKS